MQRVLLLTIGQGSPAERCGALKEYDEITHINGEPVDALCHEVGSTGVFRRKWSKAEVELDCPNWSATITMDDGQVLSSQRYDAQWKER